MLISVTQAVSIAAPRAVVLDFVGDASTLPLWAPAAPGDIDVRVSRQLGTVDFFAPGAPAPGAFSRVLPNGHGSEYLFTRFYAATTTPGDIADGNAVIARELEAVRRHCG